MKRLIENLARWAALTALALTLPLPAQAQDTGGAPAAAPAPPPPPAAAPVFSPPGGEGPGAAPGGDAGASLSPTLANDALIQYDPETDSIIVVADDDMARSIEKVIQTMDQPIPQVLIKVLFLEVRHENDLDVGLDAAFTFGRNVIPGIPAIVTPTTTRAAVPQLNESKVASSVFGAPSTGGFFKIVDENFTATLHALANADQINVLSRPSILTRNNQDATITVGQSVPFVTNTRFDANGGQVNTIEYQDVGIILEVQPHITSGRMVEMYVAPEISNIDTNGGVAISETVNAIVINKRSAVTNVVVPDGKTVVIGGMMEDDKRSSVDKIPILGDIPFIGKYLFGRTQTKKIKTELLIFLTPYVVDGPPRLAELTLDEKNRTTLAPSSFDQNEYDKFIDNIEGATGWKKNQ